MTFEEFGRRIAAMESDLTRAHRAVEAGDTVDLGDITPRLEDLCAEAVHHQGPATAIRLAVLVVRLDALEASLTERLDGSRDGRGGESSGAEPEAFP